MTTQEALREAEEILHQYLLKRDGNKNGEQRGASSVSRYAYTDEIEMRLGCHTEGKYDKKTIKS